VCRIEAEQRQWDSNVNPAFQSLGTVEAEGKLLGGGRQIVIPFLAGVFATNPRKDT
jgi:hypothetical protein